MNSSRLKKILSFDTRNYTIVFRKSKLVEIAIKKQLKKNINKLNWPSNKTLHIIKEEVFKQQLELVNLAHVYGLYSHKLFIKQKILLNSLFFIIVAIDTLWKSNWSKTFWIKNLKLISNKKDNNPLFELVKSTILHLKNPHLYRTSLVKKVLLKKTSNKYKLFEIQIVQDKTLQHLINLILEPLVEIKNDLHNYSYRSYRSAKQAVAYIKARLNIQIFLVNKKNEFSLLLPENHYILNSNIENFFCYISNQWLLKNIFLHLTLLLFITKWLNNLIFNKKMFVLTQQNAFQNGIIFSTLLNLIFNELEKAIINSINLLPKSKNKRMFILSKNSNRIQIASCLTYVRYAYNFIVLIRSRHLLKNYVIPSVKKFLEKRGLKLSLKKTKVFKLSDKNAQLDFLGYTFKYNIKWKVKSHVFLTRNAEPRGIALYSNKIIMQNFITKIKLLFKKSNNSYAYNIIVKLNPILKGWSHYFNMSNSSRYRNIVKNVLYRLIWKWAKKKHKCWGKKAIADTYFLRKIDEQNSFFGIQKHKIRKKVFTTQKYLKLKNTKWVFHDNHKSKHLLNKYKTIYLVDVVNISQLLSSKYYVIPINLLPAHNYHYNYRKLMIFNINLKFKSAGLNSLLKHCLFER